MQVTHEAIEMLRLIRYQSGAPPDAALRLAPGGGQGMTMSIAAPVVGDQVLEDQDGPVLIIAAALVPRLTGLVLDWIGTPVGEAPVEEGPSFRFLLRPPTDQEGGASAPPPPTRADR